MTELATGNLECGGGGQRIVTVCSGTRKVIEVWSSCEWRQPLHPCYALWLWGGPDAFAVKAIPGHPLYGILHDVREVDPNLWPILVDMLLDYPETADAMRKILEDAGA